MKTISVIIPVYNVEKYLVQSIESVINQTYKNLEIILVDDGSPDNSGAICDEYAKKDARIKVIHKQNGGLSSARNAALDVATGDYVAFLDSDDYLSLNAFEKCIETFSKTNADACIFSHYTTDGINHTAHSLPLEKDVYEDSEIRSIILPSFIGQKTATEQPLLGFIWRQVFKRSIIDDLRFRSEREYFAEDVVFDLEIYTKINKLSVINEPLLYYRYVESSLSNRYRERLFDKLLKLTEFKQQIVNDYQLIDCQERLHRCFFRIALGGFLNVRKSTTLTKKQKRLEINKIANNQHVKKALKKVKLNGLKERVFVLLLRLKLTGILLIFI